VREQVQVENLHTEEELSPDHALSLRQIFGEKFIALGSSGRLIRWVTALGIAQILTAVLLIGLNLVSLPAVAVHQPDGSVMFTIAWPLLLACVAFMVMAWTWLVVGALHSRLALRLPLLALFLSLHVMLTLNGDSLVGWVLLGLWAGYVVWHGVTRPEGYVRDLLVIGLGLVYFYLALIDRYSLITPGGEFATTLLSIQIAAISFLLLPFLTFAGLDLGESVRDVTRWLIGQGAARSDDRRLLWAALGISAAKVVALVIAGDVGFDWVMAGLFLLASGYISVRMRPWEGLGHEPPATLLLTATLMLTLIPASLTIVPLLWAAGTGGLANMAWGLGAMGVAAGVAALVLARRRGSTGARTAATYLALLGLWLAVYALTNPVMWNDLLGLPGAAQVHLAGLDGAAAVLLLVLLLLLQRRSLATKSIAAWAISLTLGLSVVRGMTWLVDHNFQVPAMTAVGQLVILAVGLLWDVLTSGDRWTNGDSPRVPRPARVLLYFGYVSMVVTALLFWKGSGQTGTFDEDTSAVLGLLLLGVPLYLYGFARAGVLLVYQAVQRKGVA
jgi:hypothetical protein